MAAPEFQWARQDSNLHQTGYEPAALPLSYGPFAPSYLGGREPACDTARVRSLALLLLLATPAFADEVDLTHGSRRAGEAPTWVLRAEAGNEFAPFGYIGGTLSWLAGPHNEFELGAGGGFPGLQLGLAVRQLFGDGGSFFLAELSLAGNTRVNRGNPNALLNAEAAGAHSSLWTSLGLGYEQRTDLLDFSVAADIVFTTADLTPHWSVHGGVGFGF